MTVFCLTRAPRSARERQLVNGGWRAIVVEVCERRRIRTQLSNSFLLSLLGQFVGHSLFLGDLAESNANLTLKLQVRHLQFRVKRFGRNLERKLGVVEKWQERLRLDLGDHVHIRRQPTEQPDQMNITSVALLREGRTGLLGAQKLHEHSQRDHGYLPEGLVLTSENVCLYHIIDTLSTVLPQSFPLTNRPLYAILESTYLHRWDPNHLGARTTNLNNMSKRMAANAAKVDKNKVYTLDEAVTLVKETSGVKFDAAVEVHANLGIDPKKGEQQIRATVALPHGTGKSKIIAAFVSPEKEKEAKDAGADFVYGEEEMKKIKDTGKFTFEIAVTTPDMMPKMAAVAKVLGPKGLMPNPKTETVSPNLAKMIGELKKGKITFKNDDTSNVHVGVGKVSFSADQLKENIAAFVDALKKAKPGTSKGTYIKTLVIKSAMGPAIRISEAAAE